MLPILQSLSHERVIDLDGFGPNLQIRCRIFGNSFYQNMLEKLAQHNIQIQLSSQANSSQKLQGQKVFFTGSLSQLTRNQAKELVLQNGGQLASSVSKSLDLLVAEKKLVPNSKKHKI